MLQIDLATILFEILNFVLLSFLLYRFLFKPVMARVRERAAAKAAQLDALAAEREELAAEREALAERLARLDEERATVLSQVEGEAREEKMAIVDEARAEADAIRRQAETETARWRGEAVQRFEEELVETVFDAAGDLLGRVTPAGVHEEMIAALAADVAELGREDMARVREVRRSLAGRRPTVVVETARPLDAGQQRLLLRTFAALADQEVQFEFDLDKSLLAGVRARIGDLIIDHSLAGELAQLREEVAADLRRDGGAAEEGDRVHAA